MSINPTSSKLISSCKAAGTIVKGAVNPAYSGACRGPARLASVNELNPLWDLACCPHPLYYPFDDAGDDAIIAGDTPPGCHFEIMAAFSITASGSCAGHYYDGTNFGNFQWILGGEHTPTVITGTSNPMPPPTPGSSITIPGVIGADHYIRIIRGSVWAQGIRSGAGMNPPYSTAPDYASVELGLAGVPPFQGGYPITANVGLPAYSNNCQWSGVSNFGVEVASLTAGGATPFVTGVWDGGGFLSYSGVGTIFYWGVSGGWPAGFELDTNGSWGGTFVVTWYFGRILCP